MARYRFYATKVFFTCRDEQILRHFSFYWIKVANYSTPLCPISAGKRITDIGELDERAVHVEAEVLVKILTLALQHVLRAVAEVDQLVDDPRGDQIKWRLASLERKSSSKKKIPCY